MDVEEMNVSCNNRTHQLLHRSYADLRRSQKFSLSISSHRHLVDRNYNWKSGSTFTVNASTGNYLFHESSVNTAGGLSDSASSTSQTGEISENVDLIVDVLFIFLSGMAIILGLILIVYAAVVLFDRFCCCAHLGGSDDRQLEPDIERFQSMPSAQAFGPVAFKARLWGLTSSERRTILEKVFSRYSRVYHKSNRSITMPTTTKKIDNSSSVVLNGATPTERECSTGLESSSFLSNVDPEEGVDKIVACDTISIASDGRRRSGHWGTPICRLRPARQCDRGGRG